MNGAALRQLVLFRWRSFWREPSAIVWLVAFQAAFAIPVFVARRTVDVPSILALSGTFGSMWGVGWPMMHMRITGLLRRFAVTPMPHPAFFGAFVTHRVVLATIEAVPLSLVALFADENAHAPSFVAIVAVAGLGAVAHSSVALLVTSRATNMETALTLMNLTLWPWVFGSGVFVPAPASFQAITAFTPIGAQLALFRGVVDGAPVGAAPFLVLASWTVVTYAAATRLFRWA